MADQQQYVVGEYAFVQLGTNTVRIEKTTGKMWVLVNFGSVMTPQWCWQAVQELAAPGNPS